MIKIDSAAAMTDVLASALPDTVKELLALRRDQLLQGVSGEHELGALAHWIIVEPDDPIAVIEAAAGYPIASSPPWEWVIDHGRVLEAPIVTDDAGFSVVLIVPNEKGVDPLLLSLLRRDAQGGVRFAS